jgi:hypothetical protein
MNVKRQKGIDPRMAGAVKDLQELILGRYPKATFELSHGEGDDPDGWYLTATVDIPDTDDVIDLVIDRLLHYQIDEDLQVYVIPVRPLEQVMEHWRARKEQSLLGQSSLRQLRP